MFYFMLINWDLDLSSYPAYIAQENFRTAYLGSVSKRKYFLVMLACGRAVNLKL